MPDVLMTVQDVLTILRAIVDRLEEVTIERDALMEILHDANFTPAEFQQVWNRAKSDPEIRSKARLAFAELREKLESAGLSSALEVFLKDTPVPRKPN